jgi:hypothetical protein
MSVCVSPITKQAAGKCLRISKRNFPSRPPAQDAGRGKLSGFQSVPPELQPGEQQSRTGSRLEQRQDWKGCGEEYASFLAGTLKS